MNRKERLQELLAGIRQGIAGRYRAGLALKEVRDDELYKEAGYPDWAAYCRGRWDLSRAEADRLVRDAEYHAVLADALRESAAGP
jgi:hypothetical protein